MREGRKEGELKRKGKGEEAKGKERKRMVDLWMLPCPVTSEANAIWN